MHGILELELEWLSKSQMMGLDSMVKDIGKLLYMYLKEEHSFIIIT